MEVLLSAGAAKTEMEAAFDHPNLKIVQYTDQVKALRRSKCFISRGGMASVQEAVANLTPMIIIPKIPEQQITADRVQQLGIGLHIPEEELTIETMVAAMESVIGGWRGYRENLLKLREGEGEIRTVQHGFNLIEEYAHQTTIA